jgi:hypothetical protein
MAGQNHSNGRPARSPLRPTALPILCAPGTHDSALPSLDPSRNDAIGSGNAGVTPAVFGLRPETLPAEDHNHLGIRFVSAIRSAGRPPVRQLELDNYCPHLAGLGRPRSPFLTESSG